jgi:hypothetical protein
MEYVARIRKMRNTYKLPVGKPEGRDHADDLGINEKIILKCTSGTQVWKLWIEFTWFRTGIGCELLGTR